jgi:chromosome partitioning protein
MAYFITIQNGKGGSGKTTTGVHLACAFQLIGYKVLIVDRDPQGTAMQWQSIRYGEHWRYSEEMRDALPKVLHTAEPKIARVIDEISKGYDIVIIDGSSKTNVYMADSISAADLVIMPLAPVMFDVWGVERCAELTIKRIKATNGELKAAFMFNRYTKNKDSREVATEIENAYPQLPILQTTIKQYEKIARTVGFGATVFQFPLKACQRPAAQYAALTNELIGVING